MQALVVGEGACARVDLIGILLVGERVAHNGFDQMTLLVGGLGDIDPGRLGQTSRIIDGLCDQAVGFVGREHSQSSLRPEGPLRFNAAMPHPTGHCAYEPARLSPRDLPGGPDLALPIAFWRNPTGRIVTADQWRTFATVQDHLFPSEPGAPGSGDINATAYLDAVLADADLDPDTRTFVLSGVGWLDELALEVARMPLRGA